MATLTQTFNLSGHESIDLRTVSMGMWMCPLECTKSSKTDQICS